LPADAIQAVVDAKEVVTPSGLRYMDVRTGGGAAVARGMLLLLNYKVCTEGAVNVAWAPTPLSETLTQGT
jgi:hypothetical protein